MIRNFTDDTHDITTEWGHAFALRLLDHLRARITAFQEQTGHLYNLEATPAEGTTYRFAKEDRRRFPGILQAGTEHEPITPIRASCLSALPTTRSRRWNGKRRCSANTPAGPCCISTWARSCPRPRPAANWCAGRWRISACPISPSRPHSRSAPGMAISRANTRSARAATKSLSRKSGNRPRIEEGKDHVRRPENRTGRNPAGG